MNTNMKTVIEKLEQAFWQSMVDDKPKDAVNMLTDPAMMISGKGVMPFDHETYLNMAAQEKAKVKKFKFYDVQVLASSDDAAVIAYKMQRTMKTGDGKQVELTSVNSSTWVNQDGKWL